MKKILFLALMPLLFISCSSSDDDTSSNSTSDLIGYWLGVSRTENGETEDWSDVAIYFGKDGTHIAYEYISKWKGTNYTYTVSGNTLTTKSVNFGTTESCTIVSVSSTSLVLYQDGVTTTWKKVSSIE